MGVSPSREQFHIQQRVTTLERFITHLHTALRLLPLAAPDCVDNDKRGNPSLHHGQAVYCHFVLALRWSTVGEARMPK